MRESPCFVFPDKGDWIVFAPITGLLVRCNEAAAVQFRGLVDRLPAGERFEAAEGDVFEPTHVTVSCGNTCGQQCVYCYGTPAHANRDTLDPGFCRAGAALAAGNAAKRDEPFVAHFHGLGEPTHNWRLFTQCVEIVRAEAEAAGARAHLRLVTGGQMERERAEWVVERLDAIDVSMDGPRDVQNRQRPRADGRDSYERPIALLAAAAAAGRSATVRTTVTRATAGRMAELVELTAREAPGAGVKFGMVFPLAWAQIEETQSPRWEDYVAGFEEALDLGTSLGVQVDDADVTKEGLTQPFYGVLPTHFCLATPNIVTQFYDVPAEGAANPRLGAYGWYDPASGRIDFDHARRKQIKETTVPKECVSCPCRLACHGHSGVRGRMPVETDGPRDETCLARLGVLKALLRRMLPSSGRVEEALHE